MEARQVDCGDRVCVRAASGVDDLGFAKKIGRTDGLPRGTEGGVCAPGGKTESRMVGVGESVLVCGGEREWFFGRSLVKEARLASSGAEEAKRAGIFAIGRREEG